MSIPWDWSNFDTSLAASGMVAVVAVMLGIPAGLWINRRFESRQVQRERRRIREHQLAVLKAVKGEIEHNRELLDEMEPELHDDVIPSYMLDMGLWEAARTEAIAAIQSEALMEVLPRLYFQYRHFQRKVDALVELYVHPSAAMSATQLKPVWQIRFDNIRQSMIAQIPMVRESQEHAASLLESEIGRLSATEP